MAYGFSAVVWSICVAIYLVLVIIAYATPEWIVSSNDEDFYSQMGPIVRCQRDLSGTDACGRWGSAFHDWPIRAWKAAVIFDGLALALIALVWIFSCITCVCCFSLHNGSKFLLILTELLILLGIFSFVGGLRDTSDPEVGVNTCMSSAAFRPGSGCHFGWSGIIACVALVWGLVPTIWAFCMDEPDDYDADGSEA